MKILVVCPFIPSPTSGNRTRSYQLLRILARSHTVSLVAIDDGSIRESPQNMALLENLAHRMEVLPYTTSYPKRLRQLMYVVSGRSNTIGEHTTKGMVAVLKSFLSRGHYDVLIFECALTAAALLPEHVKVILDQHNIEFEILQRAYKHEKTWLRKWYNWRESRLVEPVEIELCRRADAVTMTSERERLLLKGRLPRSKIEVVPNGVDTEYFHGDCSDQEVNGRIIFTGSMEYYPNIQAVLFFAEKCWPLIRKQVPDATWLIVGKNPVPEVLKLAELPGVTVTGSVADVRPYFNEATVAIAPLLVGSGTRLKILEAMAMYKAVVSTSLGCEGLTVVPGKHLLIADQPAEFAHVVAELLNNPEKRRALGMTGRALVEAVYSWEQCGQRLLQLVEEMGASVHEQ